MFFTRSTLMSKCFCIGGGWEIESVTGEEGEKEEREREKESSKRERSVTGP